jgi:hypothetical protein
MEPCICWNEDAVIIVYHETVLSTPSSIFGRDGKGTGLKPSLQTDTQGQVPLRDNQYGVITYLLVCTIHNSPISTQRSHCPEVSSRPSN